MSGVPAGKLTLFEAARRYLALRGQAAPTIEIMVALELKAAFAARELDAFVGSPGGAASRMAR
jgi:hypothetical protein